MSMMSTGYYNTDLGKSSIEAAIPKSGDGGELMGHHST